MKNARVPAVLAPPGLAGVHAHAAPNSCSALRLGMPDASLSPPLFRRCVQACPPSEPELLLHLPGRLEIMPALGSKAQQTGPSGDRA